MTMLLATLVGLVVAYAAVAVIIDPRGIFSTGVFPVVVWDSRQEKMRLFSKFNEASPVECIVLGSSRAMKVSPQQVERETGLRTFNFCVDSARSEDYLAIYRWVSSRSPRLKTMLIGLDVEALHCDDEFDRRLTSNAQLMSGLDDTAEPGPSTRSCPALSLVSTVMSVPYARDMASSLRVLLSSSRPRNQLEDDGYLHYTEWEQARQRGSLDLAENIKASYEEYRRRFGGMSALSPQRERMLRQLLHAARKDGLEVAVWITPIHPAVATYISAGTHYTQV
ncbi:MAG: hypothetical protein MUE60_00120, partial [Candidatus Eisenbacteria bacterium]|nr:hypothetical protein [Candidatus Eisenbacteria bacterium]